MFKTMIIQAESEIINHLLFMLYIIFHFSTTVSRFCRHFHRTKLFKKFFQRLKILEKKTNQDTINIAYKQKMCVVHYNYCDK